MTPTEAPGLDGTKWLLARLGYHLQPENSIYLQTLAKIGGKERVQVEMKNGRHIRGIPGAGPAAQDDGINELYLTHPEGPLEDGSWQSLGAAAIVKLDEASVIVLAVDPTNKPPKTLPSVTQESQPPALEGALTPMRNGVPLGYPGQVRVEAASAGCADGLAKGTIHKAGSKSDSASIRST